jgi:hypothetical protein
MGRRRREKHGTKGKSQHDELQYGSVLGTIGQDLSTLLCTFLCKGPVYNTKEVVALPIGNNPTHWHFSRVRVQKSKALMSKGITI